MKCMNNIKMAVLSLAFFTVTACGGEPEAISIVKKGKLKSCPRYSVEEMINASMEKPKWKHSVGKNGVDYVTVSGLIVTGRPTEGVWQLWVRNNTFGTQALELDKKPQNELGLIALIGAMCKTAKDVGEQKAVAAAEARIAGVKKGSFTDARDGKTYKTVKLDNQTWMAENLNYDAKNSKCYDNKPDNCTKYGRLYDWETAKKACPAGWHLPSDEEWDTFTRDDKIAGKRLKAKSGWNNNGNGTDDYGFSALPGGFSYSNGGDSYVGDNGYWWSASEYNSDFAYYRQMDDNNEDVNYYLVNPNKSNLYSVRCVQD